jgi:hypothetical protein
MGKRQGLVKTTEAMGTIEAKGPAEPAMVWLLVQACRRRLRGPVELGPE